MRIGPAQRRTRQRRRHADPLLMLLQLLLLLILHLRHLTAAAAAAIDAIRLWRRRDRHAQPIVIIGCLAREYRLPVCCVQSVSERIKAVWREPRKDVVHVVVRERVGRLWRDRFRLDIVVSISGIARRRSSGGRTRHIERKSADHATIESSDVSTACLLVAFFGTVASAINCVRMRFRQISTLDEALMSSLVVR